MGHFFQQKNVQNGLNYFSYWIAKGLLPESLYKSYIFGPHSLGGRTNTMKILKVFCCITCLTQMDSTGIGRIFVASELKARPLSPTKRYSAIL